MTNKAVAQRYIELLGKGAVQEVVKLFTKDGIVYSPLYGAQSAGLFYKKLKEDTNSSELIINGIFEEKDSNRIALYFKFIWVLANNKRVAFEVVDILQFDSDHKIESLKIIYDASTTRTSWNELK